MRYFKLLPLSLLLFTEISNAQVVTTFPYNEDFEGFPLCSSGASVSCSVPSPWNNDTQDDIDWRTDYNGTPSSGTGPTIDYNPGIYGGKYLFTEASSGYTNKTANLESPWFDFTSLISPTLVFSYHMYGSTMGTLAVQVRTGQNAPWSTIVPAFTQNANSWSTQFVDLLAYTNEDSLQVRWQGVTGSAYISDMALDDIWIIDKPASEIEVLTVNYPITNYCLGVEPVTVTYTQNEAPGLAVGDTLFLSYSDGTNAFYDTIELTTAFAQYDTLTHTFFPDLSALGTYNIAFSVTSNIVETFFNSNNSQSASLNIIDPSVFSLSYINSTNTIIPSTSTISGGVFSWNPANSGAPGTLNPSTGTITGPVGINTYIVDYTYCGYTFTNSITITASDLEMTSIQLPTSTTCLGVEPINVSLTQLVIPSNPVDTLFITYSDGINLIEDTLELSPSMGINDVVNHTFYPDLSTITTYNITVTVTSNVPEVNLGNNTINTTFTTTNGSLFDLSIVSASTITSNSLFSGGTYSWNPSNTGTSGTLDTSTGMITGITMTPGETYIVDYSYCSTLYTDSITIPYIPGGISGNTVWYKANGTILDASMAAPANSDPVAQWNDEMLGEQHLSQATVSRRPTFMDIGANYNPAVRFNNASNTCLKRSIPYPEVFHQTHNTVFIVNKHLGGTVWAQWESSNNSRIGLEANGTASRFDFPNNSTSNRTLGSTNILNKNILLTGYTDSTLNTININNYQEATLIRGTLKLTTVSGTLAFGATGVVNNFTSSCEFSEYLVYPEKLNEFERRKVATYLSLKHGITLSNTGGGNQGDYVATNDVLIWDADLNSSYHNNVIGIGRDDIENLLQKQSHTTDDTSRIYLDVLQTSNIANTGTFPSDISYVVMGENQGQMCATVSSNAEIPLSCNVQTRIEREWKVTKTNFHQNFHVDLTLAGCANLGNVNPSDLTFLVDDDGDFSNGGTSCYTNGDGTGIIISYSAPIITISNISATHILNNSVRYFTIGSLDLNSTPLPVEFKHFTANCTDEEVHLSWETISEENNDYFTVESSLNLVDFEEIAIISGAGNSTDPNSYFWSDDKRRAGISYYRLSQTDYNGNREILGVTSVDCEANGVISIYPNPLENKLFFTSEESGELQLVDNTGRIVLQESINAGTGSIDLVNIASGVYTSVFITNNGIKHSTKLIKL